MCVYNMFHCFSIASNYLNLMNIGCHCGRAQRSKIIIGGSETEISEYPWMAYVATRQGSMCGCAG